MMDTSVLSIPGKNFYKFHELTAMTGVKPYVLRFWETEFSEISPEVDELGNKVYSLRDLHLIEKVKNLLFEEKLSIPQAKLRLSELANRHDVEEGQEQVGRSSLVEEQNESYALFRENHTPRNPLQFLSDVKVQLRSGLELIDRIKQRQNWPLSGH